VRSSLPDAVDYIEPDSRLSYEIHQTIRQGIDLEGAAIEAEDDPFWKELCELGTEVWLDTGDVEAIEPIWSRQFSGLTTNNTLLNEEVQKGIYDDLIASSDKSLGDLDSKQRVREIALILNARHGLRLVEKYRCPVSVELHTDLAHDTDASVATARRLCAICPDYFIVKIPFTPAGILATRVLRDEGLPINMTLGFGARQNYLATALAGPSYVNVFLGRIGSYFSENDLGNGDLTGEKAALASQTEVSIFTRGIPQCQTKQIAASIRSADQLQNIAGIDVVTLPPHIAVDAKQQLDGRWSPRLKEQYEISLAPDVDGSTIRVDTLWEVSAETRKFVQQMILNQPSTAEQLVEAAADYGVHDLFPKFSKSDLKTLSDQGKIPQHQVWGDRILGGRLGIDSLLTTAGLCDFAASQAELDERIRKQLGSHLGT
jgi:transaldolase